MVGGGKYTLNSEFLNPKMLPSKEKVNWKIEEFSF